MYFIIRSSMKKQNGFSLVELLITCSLLGVVVFGAMTILQNQKKPSSKKIQ